MIAVTFALPAESSAFQRLLREKLRCERNGLPTIRGKIDNSAVELLHTGVGEAICRERLAKFLEDRRFEFLISAGFAGALTDELQLGELILARNFSTLPRREESGFREANLYSAPAIIDALAEREKLARITGAMAVDMETKFIARACAEHALPMLALRVISDTPAEPLPAPPDVLFNLMRQQTELSAVASFFLAHPSRIPTLIQFTRRIARARKTLANAIVDAIRQLET